MLNLKSLRFNDPILKQTLWTGRMQTEDGEKLAILKTVRSDGNKEFVFELVNPRVLLRPNFIKRLSIGIRMFSLTAVISPGLVVLGAGIIFEKWHANFLLFFASLLSVSLLQIAVNVFNDVHDHIKGVDLPGDLGGSGVIQKGWFSAKTFSTIGVISVIFATALATFPLAAHPKELIGLGLCAFIGGIGYSGLGLGLKYRALGDLAVFFLCGPILTLGFSVVAFGLVSVSIILIGVIFGLAAVGILHANNLNDLEIDKDRGARTVANQIGFKWSQKYLSFIYLTILFICILSAALLRQNTILFISPLLVSPFVYQLIKRVKQATGPLSPSISMIRFQAAKIHLLVGISWFAVFVIKPLL